MTAVDLGRIAARGDYVRRQLAELRETGRTMGADAFAGDRDAPPAARYRLQTAIEALIDIAYHLAAKGGRQAAKDAHEAFEAMVRLGILEASAMPRYHAMLRFRNLVVHGYLNIDDRQIYAMITGEDARDIEEVLRRFEAGAARLAEVSGSGPAQDTRPAPADAG